jgi:hypothetical protein
VKHSILAVVSALSCVAVCVACSSSSNKGSGGPGDGGSGEGGVGDGGAGDSGGDGGSSGGSLPYFGSLAASRTASGLYTIAGDFFATPDAGTPTACPSPSVLSGSCCYTPPAVASDAGASDAGTLALVSAGVITFTDGTTPLAAISPGTDGAYAVGSDKNVTVKWTPGDKITVSAAGDVVKAFTGSLTTVDDIAGVTPALSLTTEATVPIASNLDVTWTAGNATSMVVLLTAVKGKAGDGSILCDVADSAGTVSVPTALLSKLTTGDVGTITLTRSTVTTVTGSNATVELVGTATASGLLKYQ